MKPIEKYARFQIMWEIANIKSIEPNQVSETDIDICYRNGEVGNYKIVTNTWNGQGKTISTFAMVHKETGLHYCTEIFTEKEEQNE